MPDLDWLIYKLALILPDKIGVLLYKQAEIIPLEPDPGNAGVGKKKITTCL